MSELRVPTVAMAAEVTCLDGRAFRGRIFVPAAASTHQGQMRAEEWMNGAGRFFPFLPDDAEQPVILNKNEVLMVSVEAAADGPPPEPTEVQRRIIVECGARVLEGEVRIDMPAHHRRVLDYLNRPDAFLPLHEDGRVHLVQKHNITRVIEVAAS